MSAALLVTIGGLALLDSLNPSLFITQLVLLATPRPLPRALAYIVGVWLTNLIAGLLVLLGVQAVLLAWFQALDPALPRAAEAVAGLVLLLIGALMRPAPAATEARAPLSLRPLHTFVLGAAITIQEFATALPYLVAIERVARADLAPGAALALLAGYNLIYIAPLLLFVGGVAALRERLLPRLGAVNAAVAHWLPRVARVALPLIGAALLADAAAFFLTGAALF